MKRNLVLLLVCLTVVLSACSQSPQLKSDKTEEDLTSSQASLTGTVWHDANQDTYQSKDEQGLADWVVYLDKNDNGKLDPDETHVKTNAEGNYAFTGLESGAYVVSQVLKEGWVDTFSDFEGLDDDFYVKRQIADQLGSTVQPHIIGGNPADRNEYPWMVALLSRGSDATQGHFCGGALIAKRFVLTAAHCLEDTTANQVDVLVGATELNQASQGERIEVAKVHLYPNYDGTEMLGDVAILELVKESTKPTLSLMKASKLELQAAGETATVMGWGNRSTNGEDFPNQLHEVAVPIRTDASCTAAYNVQGEQYNDAWICAASPQGAKDSCQGDSGGPLIVREGQDWYHAGIVSFGDVCGSATQPGVYAQTSTYLPWIQSISSGNTTPNPVPIPSPEPHPNPEPSPEPNPEPDQNAVMSYFVELVKGETVDQLDFGNTRE